MGFKRKIIYDEVHTKDWNGTWLGEIGFFYRRYGGYGTGVEVMVGDREWAPLSRWTKLYDDDQTHMHNEFNMEFEVDGKIFPAKYKHYGDMWGYGTDKDEVRDYLSGRDRIRYRVYIYVPYNPPGIPSSISVTGDYVNNGIIKGDKEFTVSWKDGELAERYHLEQRVNNDKWTQIYYGTLKSQKITPKDNWDTVQYRVRAYNKDGYSSFRTSNIYEVKHFPEMFVKIDDKPREVIEGWVRVDNELKSISEIYTNINGKLTEL